MQIDLVIFDLDGVLVDACEWHRLALNEALKEVCNNGIKVACYTNSIRETGSLMLKKTGVYELFDLFVSNQEVPKPKPDPIGYIQIMEHFGINKSNTLIIEDSEKGLLAALNSGAKVIKVAGPDHVNIELFRSKR